MAAAALSKHIPRHVYVTVSTSTGDGALPRYTLVLTTGLIANIAMLRLADDISAWDLGRLSGVNIVKCSKGAVFSGSTLLHTVIHVGGLVNIGIDDLNASDVVAGIYDLLSEPLLRDQAKCKHA